MFHFKLSAMFPSVDSVGLKNKLDEFKCDAFDYRIENSDAGLRGNRARPSGFATAPVRGRSPRPSRCAPHRRPSGRQAGPGCHRGMTSPARAAAAAAAGWAGPPPPTGFGGRRRRFIGHPRPLSSSRPCALEPPRMPPGRRDGPG